MSTNNQNPTHERYKDWMPRVTVATVVRRGDQFLCVREMATVAGKTGKFEALNQPAGHVERGETLVQAALRETLEETGYQVTLTGLLGIYTMSPEPDRTYYRFCFLAEAGEFMDTELDKRIIAAEWLTLDQIRAAAHLRSPLVLACCEDALVKPVLPLSLIDERFLSLAASTENASSAAQSQS